MPDSSTPFIRPHHWLIAPLAGLLSAPLWLGWFEPGLFYALNRAFSLLPDLFWSLLALLGTGWAVFAFTSPALARRNAFVSSAAFCDWPRAAARSSSRIRMATSTS